MMYPMLVDMTLPLDRTMLALLFLQPYFLPSFCLDISAYFPYSFDTTLTRLNKLPNEILYSYLITTLRIYFIMCKY